MVAEVMQHLVVGRLREMVEPHGERAGVGIGNQVNVGVVDLPQPAPLKITPGPRRRVLD